MSGHLKTENCIICGSRAVEWHGHVRARQRMALGNFIEKRVVAGFCEKHGTMYVCDETGCYGNYDPDLMGKCTPLTFN